eukprot:CAMPEP_0196692144 /NCGR_PEP_ID=MMETSP1090-20130531/26626_1 /TAXON_ID=37098 /ORGANISM="Isochrysis sp, Strain CCMP1244" /LENGTH=51 /DNA_ID=CAMNT_0042031479 /DNA_START=279 /DNA_END=430 /DNA_ORIENTATION=-
MGTPARNSGLQTECSSAASGMPRESAVALPCDSANTRSMLLSGGRLRGSQP